MPEVTNVHQIISGYILFSCIVPLGKFYTLGKFITWNGIMYEVVCQMNKLPGDSP